MTSGGGGSADLPGIDHKAIAVLGLLTIAAYGSWYYSFGVLLDPIRLDTGWSEAQLAGSFSIGSIVMGFGSIFGGRTLDRLGNRAVMLIGGSGGASALLATSFATNALVFTLTAAVAMGFLGAFGFYHVTMTTAVRVNPASPAKAIATLTIWGAFASAVYLPMTAALVERLAWRDTIRILAVIVGAVFALAAAVIPSLPPADRTDEDRAEDDKAEADEPAAVPSIREVLASTVSTPERRAFTAAVALGGIAMSTVLVYQVPSMTAAGLPLSTAATLAGIRGFAQTGGRIPLNPMVRRLGIRGTLVLAFVAMTVGGGLLAFSGTIVVALCFAIVTGFGIGAFSPLQGMTAEDLFERETLGATMGSYSTVLMVAGASGPAMAGVLADATGDRRIASVIIVIAAGGALVAAVRLWSLRPALT